MFSFFSKNILFTSFSLVAFIYSSYDLLVLSSLSSYIEIFRLTFNFVLFFLLYQVMLTKIEKFSLMSIGIGVFAGIISVLGRNFMLYENLIFFYKAGLFAYLFSVISAIGYGMIYATLFEFGWRFFMTSNNTDIDKTKIISKMTFLIFEKRPFLMPLFFICIFWLPYLIAFFPGVLHWDAMSALQKYYGIGEWTSHFPVVSTLIMGYTMDFGKFLGSDNYGCSIYVLLQLMLVSSTLAYSFIFFKLWKTNYFIRWIILLIFSLLPNFPMYCMNVIKDTLYYVSVLWLLYLFLLLYRKYSTKIIIYTIIVSMIVCFLRKEGIIICSFCALVLLIFQKNVYIKWRNVATALVIGSLLSLVFTNALSDYYKIKSGPIRECFSLPVQQTARYIKDHEKEITSTEWKILNDIFPNRAKILGKVYDPNRSDAVKNSMRFSLNYTQIRDYLSVWFIHFRRHPGCYISAAFNQMYGYFYLEKPEFNGSTFRTSNFKEGHKMYCKHIVVKDNTVTKNIRDLLISYFKSWKRMPLFGLLWNPATYFWLLLFDFTYIIRTKNYEYLFLFCIPVVALLVCCLSPLNASIRYGFPVMLCSLILLAFSVTVKMKNEDIVDTI